MPDPVQAPSSLGVVMLVDDDLFMLNFMAEMLLDLGASSIVKSSNARDALKTFAEVKADLLIVDLRMPDMDGIEFLDRVAQLRYAGKVILHSGVDAGVMRAAERLATAHGLHVLGAFEKVIDRATLQHLIAPTSPSHQA
ncbi:MAG: response regulator [Burkholderiales bacterium]|nr:response regulator [Burkholderiales bacterium]